MGNTKIMHISDIKLTPNRKRFVELANSEGFAYKISRKDIIILQAKYGIKMPYWLTRNLIFRYEKGVYWLPNILSEKELIKGIAKSYVEHG